MEFLESSVLIWGLRCVNFLRTRSAGKVEGSGISWEERT